MSKAVETQDLVKRFGELTAVRGISFDVEQGEIFGFLGPNGAGKSTTINMLCTLLKVTSGWAKVGGYDVANQPGAVRQSIGIVFQDPSLDDRLTGWENLRFHALLYDLSRSVFTRRAEELLRMVDLYDRRDHRVRGYSGGMRRRLEIARGLLHRPKVLFLDEPTIGLDPQTRRYIWEYIQQLRQREEVTVFMTTHYMDEAEVCDRVAIMDHGEIIALDTVEGLKEMVGGDVITLHTSDNERAAAKIQQEKGLTPRAGADGGLTVEVEHGEAFIPQLMLSLSDGTEPVEVQSVRLHRPTLEDVFIKLTGRAIREEEGDIGREHMRQDQQLRRGGRNR
jgi:ABC-2 type transport system ATP-binding protein